MKVDIGDKVYIAGEKRPYKVRARDNRYIICTKPCFDTVLYFIIDLIDRWRGPDDRTFCSGYETEEDCQERLKEFQDGTIEVSSRRGVRLDLDIE